MDGELYFPYLILSIPQDLREMEHRKPTAVTGPKQKSISEPQVLSSWVTPLS
jgi:hypothetical protein